jgi:hypothetical protein
MLCSLIEVQRRFEEYTAYVFKFEDEAKKSAS